MVKIQEQRSFSLVPSLVLGAALALAFVAPASAGKSVSLTTGGNTIGGPGSSTIAAAASQVVYLDDDGDVDVCVTVVNSGKANVDIALSSEVNVVPNTILAGATSSFCQENTTEVELTCSEVASPSCSVQWRIDAN